MGDDLCGGRVGDDQQFDGRRGARGHDGVRTSEMMVCAQVRRP